MQPFNVMGSRVRWCRLLRSASGIALVATLVGSAGLQSAEVSVDDHFKLAEQALREGSIEQ